MAKDQDVDGDWEESLVLVELSGIIEQDWVQHAGDACTILGIDTDQPLLQFGRYVFMGEYQDLIGTAVLFEQPEDAASAGGNPQWKYKCHTFKKCLMQRAFLAEKEESPTHEYKVDRPENPTEGDATAGSEEQGAVDKPTGTATDGQTTGNIQNGTVENIVVTKETVENAGESLETPEASAEGAETHMDIDGCG